MNSPGTAEMTTRKILAVRIGRVGDTVMMTPALRALIDYYPDAEITLLTSPVGKLLLKDFHPNVREIWTWDRSGLLQPARDKRKLLSLLKANDFDRIICFDTSPRIARLFTEAGKAFDQFTGTTELIPNAGANRANSGKVGRSTSPGWIS